MNIKFVHLPWHRISKVYEYPSDIYVYINIPYLKEKVYR